MEEHKAPEYVGAETNMYRGDGEHRDLEKEVKSRDEVLSKLLQLLRSYGLELPTTVPELETALASITEMAQRAGDTTAVPLSAGATAAAVDPVRRMLAEGSKLWTDFDVDVEERFKQFQQTIPSASGTPVVFSHLNYEVTRAAGSTGEPTVGDVILKVGGALLCVPLLKRIIKGAQPANTKTVVRDASGVFKSGELTLVIGPPGCGKSSLLKLLAGLVKPDKSHRVKGDMLYKGEKISRSGHSPSLPKIAAYVQQGDRHVALLTVKETLNFAFDSMEGGQHASWIPHHQRTKEQHELISWMDKRYSKVHMIMRILGLSAQADTIVGDVLTRGISGGERRRVTLGEMLCGSQDVFLMDSISNGLDSSTTFDIIDTLKKAARNLGKTMVVALLQPPPEVYKLFDHVIIMATGGRIIYQGKTEDVQPYFRSIGYKCPPRKDEADFVVEVSTDQGSLYRIQGVDEEGLLVINESDIPQTPAQFEKLWRASPGHATVERDVAEYSTPPTVAEGKSKWPPNQSRLHAGSWNYHFKTCIKKHWILSKRDLPYTKQHLGLALFMGLVMGSIFFGLSANSINDKFGVLFFALLYLGLGGMAQLPAAIESRNVFYKQHAQGFYSASADVMAQVMVQAIITIAETLIFAPILYFMVGLSTEGGAGRFFIFLAILIATNLNLAAYFRSIAAIMPNFSAAQTIGGLTLVFIVLFCGFLVPEPDIPGVWIWIFWLNPLSWAFRGVILNEFLSPKYKSICSTPVPPGQACPVNLSQAALGSYGFRQDPAFIWGAILFTAGMWLLTCFVTGLVLHHLRYDASDNAPIIMEEQALFEQDTASSDGASSSSSMNASRATTPAAKGGSSNGGTATATVHAHDEQQQQSHATSAGPEQDRAIRLASGTAASAARTTDRRRTSRYESDAAVTKAECDADVARVTKRMQSDSQVDVANAFVPITLAFRHVGYSVPHPSGDGQLELLKDINGFAKPGTMTALMGSSGAGKTTLLDVLAGRKTGGSVTGDITLNGYAKEQRSFARVAGYVEQMDTHSPVVTVREAVDFSATMRLQETDWSPERREVFVDGILEILELTTIKDRLIGSEETGGLANEQRKRVTIAVELAANPSLLFLDEPTTGLDARSAQVVMRAIRKVAATGRAVICTIHQPSTYLFEMFDSLLLLKKGGETVYFGELGVHSKNLIHYLSAIPGTPAIKDNANPATYMLEVIGAGTTARINSQMFADWYANGVLKQKTDVELDALTQIQAGSQPLSFPTQYAASMATQRKAHIKRAYRQYWRSPNYNFARIMIVIIQALVFGSSFVNYEPATVSDVASIFGVTFMVIVFLGVTYFQSAIPFTSMERAVYYREQAARMYNVVPYSMSYFLAEIPYILFNTLLFVTIFYLMANFERDAAKFFWFWFFFMLNTTVMVFLGHAFTALLSTIKAAQSMGSLCTSFFSLFAGFLISPGSIPSWWIWMYWLCPLHYTIEGILSTQFHDDDRVILALDGITTTTVSAYFTEFFGGKYSYDHRGYDVLALFIFIVVARFMFFYAAAYVRHEKR